jgi:hypothetical protein
MGKALDQEMYNYFMRLNDAEKKSVIQMLKTFLKGRKEEDTEPVTVEEYNRELDEAEAEFARGEYITHAALLKQMKSWKDGK